MRFTFITLFSLLYGLVQAQYDIDYTVIREELADTAIDIRTEPYEELHSVNKPGLQAFYGSYYLHADSAETPYLYYQVYDWLGTRYKYSGKSKTGIDCSGFVCEMYKNTYCIDLNGISSGNLFHRVKPVEKAELKEGDLLFFKIKKGRISHVGVYLGNNKFAHASVHSGVVVSDLEEAYYKRYFFKGGRLLD